ncbi:MAG: hypothetical protein R3A44_17995 [Caldilineaceae bacterium]
MREPWTNWPPAGATAGRELRTAFRHTLSARWPCSKPPTACGKPRRDQAHTLLVKSIANARSGLAETRRALQDLRASPLEDLGLGLALRTLAESTAKRAGLELMLDVPKQVDGLTAEQEQGVYRIAQEALENVVKHAGAHKLSVLLRQGDSAQWRLTVRDDGRSFDPAGWANGHYGVQRDAGAPPCRAVLQIESTVGETTVRLEI